MEGRYLKLINLNKFLKLSKNYNLIPIYKEIIVDTETPVTLYKKVGLKHKYSYLLESVEGGRHSFIGMKPDKIFKMFPDGFMVDDNNGIYYQNTDMIKYLNKLIKSFNVLNREELPPFSGGVVGFFGYEMIEKWEELYHDQVHKKLKYPGKQPLSIFVLSRTIIAYDHLHNTVKVINNIKVDEKMSREKKKKLYYRGREEIEEVINSITIEQEIYKEEKKYKVKHSGNMISNTGKSIFKNMVKQAKENIEQGEIFQIVLSQKFSVKSNLDPFQIFRALRVLNPSPYLYYLNFPEIKLVGSSPEVLVRVKGKKVITRPLAGTRPRGRTKKEDLELEKDLKTSLKEKAEHIMLVDLGRNDLGRVCKTGSVKVSELLGIEKYSQVMHLVSQVEGEKREGLTGLDILKAVFPAGTVSGAPKIRAIELINELEKEARGPYAGAVGYIDFRGNVDTCITIRTFTVENGKLSVQAGAGIVADSIPDKEYEETLNKARALFRAFEMVKEEKIHDFNYR